MSLLVLKLLTKTSLSTLRNCLLYQIATQMESPYVKTQAATSEGERLPVVESAIKVHAELTITEAFPSPSSDFCP